MNSRFIHILLLFRFVTACHWTPYLASSVVPAFALGLPRKHSHNTQGQKLIRQSGNQHQTSSTLYCLKASKNDYEAFNSKQDQIEAAGENKDMEKSQRTIGILVLLSVPLSWGTYAPVVRYVYEMNPPIPGIVFSAGYYIVAALSLLSLEAFSTWSRKAEPLTHTNQVEPNEHTMNSMAPIMGGLELGTYLFIGNLLQVIGLKTVPADRAAFLVQLTTIFVPLAQAIVVGNLFAIPARTWLACIIAFLGVVVMGFDGHEAAAIHGLVQAWESFWNGNSYQTPVGPAFRLSQIFTGGDFLVVSAALAYTMHVLRLSSYVRKTTPLRLAGAKATVESLWSLALVILLGSLRSPCSSDAVSTNLSAPTFICDLSNEITSYFTTLQSSFASGILTVEMWTPALLACLWTGLITCAYTIYAQSFGQRRVEATEANLIYSAQPVFSAFFAWGLLGEKLGTAGFIGGGLIALALWLVTTSSTPKNDSEKFAKKV